MSTFSQTPVPGFEHIFVSDPVFDSPTSFTVTVTITAPSDPFPYPGTVHETYEHFAPSSDTSVFSSPTEFWSPSTADYYLPLTQSLELFGFALTDLINTLVPHEIVSH